MDFSKNLRQTLPLGARKILYLPNYMRPNESKVRSNLHALKTIPRAWAMGKEYFQFSCFSPRE